MAWIEDDSKCLTRDLVALARLERHGSKQRAANATRLAHRARLDYIAGLIQLICEGGKAIAADTEVTASPVTTTTSTTITTNFTTASNSTTPTVPVYLYHMILYRIIFIDTILSLDQTG